MKNRLILLGVVALIAVVLAAGYFYTSGYFNTSFDARLKEALKGVQAPHTYEMLDETHATISGRSIEIIGLYTLDFDAKRYGTNSTTTLTDLSELPPHTKNTFTLAHRSIGDDIYVKIETNSPLLKKTIPYGPMWRHFTVTTVPERFVDIAVPGAILDNLALLSNNGSYLELSDKPHDETIASSTYHVYSFTLSKKAAAVPSGQLRSLLDLIATGTVDVLIDDTPSVRLLRFSGPSYQSTTTILNLNTPVEVLAPDVSE